MQTKLKAAQVSCKKSGCWDLFDLLNRYGPQAVTIG